MSDSGTKKSPQIRNKGSADLHFTWDREELRRGIDRGILFSNRSHVDASIENQGDRYGRARIRTPPYLRHRHSGVQAVLYAYF